MPAIFLLFNVRWIPYKLTCINSLCKVSDPILAGQRQLTEPSVGNTVSQSWCGVGCWTTVLPQ